jgi:light-regulated signal transduction histidine kinase (bacteriophytochrome)
MRDYVRRLLAEHHEVRAVDDGHAALAAARERRPDLVLTDVMMPGLDGFGLLRALRADPATRTVPVIMLSARAGEEATISGLEAGADDYLVKPFSARELIARVQTHLDLARLRREWSEELAAANAELESFSYSVSHDLRAPLRAIDGFARMLEQDHGKLLDENGRHYLDRVRSGTRRMGVLIDDLLELARVSRVTMLRAPIDLSALAGRVLADLQARDPGRAIELRVAPGLHALGDARLVTILFENLLGNAWKFTGKTAAPRIEVGQATGPDGPAFFVRDNGAGFDAAYASRLFKPFQRLHTEREFEGTGIGLATVQKIIARHHGRIWTEAAVDQGATFYFMLDETAERP